jgi:hypothetical protein
VIAIFKKQWSKMVSSGPKWSGDAKRLGTWRDHSFKTVVKSGQKWSEVVRRCPSVSAHAEIAIFKSSGLKWP